MGAASAAGEGDAAMSPAAYRSTGRARALATTTSSHTTWRSWRSSPRQAKTASLCV